ncbi:Hydroxymethylpyrimidine/phosphomethylpyrimidine kinase [Gammaproteobacteria bacterium]
MAAAHLICDTPLNQHPPTYPIVICFSGHDATAGAGLAADIETLMSLGCHPAPVVTAVTVQDTTNVKSFVPLLPSLVTDQARTVLEDMGVAVIKIGMIGSIENVEAIHSILRDYPSLPVVLDPVLRAGGGTPLGDDELVQAITELLLPLTTILTPNSQEARALAPAADTLDACAHQILETGCRYVLITGTHERTEQVINTFYGNHRTLESFTWNRFEQVYHGSGCTLASAIAALLAQGMNPNSAVREAQEYTWTALRYGYRVGMGQLIPDRLFWARDRKDLVSTERTDLPEDE